MSLEVALPKHGTGWTHRTKASWSKLKLCSGHSRREHHDQKKRAIPPDIKVLEKLVQDPETISGVQVNSDVFGW